MYSQHIKKPIEKAWKKTKYTNLIANFWQIQAKRTSYEKTAYG